MAAKPRKRQLRHWRGKYAQIHRHQRHKCHGCGHLVQDDTPVMFCRVPRKRTGVWVLHQRCEHLESVGRDGTVMSWGERFREYAKLK